MIDRRHLLVGLGTTAVVSLVPVSDTRAILYFLFDDDELASVVRPWIDYTRRQLVEVDLRKAGFDLRRIECNDRACLWRADDYGAFSTSLRKLIMVSVIVASSIKSGCRNPTLAEFSDDRRKPLAPPSYTTPGT